MKIFITGASGFIGTELLNQLENTKYEPVCLVRKTSPNFETVKSRNVKVVEGDVRDKSTVLEGMQGCDWVINLAALYTFWEVDNSLYHAINVEGTRNVMESALENKVSKIAHVSSVVTFGKSADNPFSEKSEPGPLLSRYAKTKSEGGKIVWDMYKKSNLPVVFIYPGVVLGAGNKKTSGQYVSDVVNKKLPAQVFNNVAFTWVHVKDVAMAILKALEKEDNIGEKYIIGNSLIPLGVFNKMITEISGTSLPKLSMPAWLAMANASLLTGISRLTKKKPILNMYADQIRTMKNGIYADGSKAERELGIIYTPIRVALEEEVSASKK